MSFTLQNGPIKENGKNGCQIDHMIEACVAILTGLNKQHYSPFNDRALSGLRFALAQLEARRFDREMRNVEDHNKE